MITLLLAFLQYARLPPQQAPLTSAADTPANPQIDLVQGSDDAAALDMEIEMAAIERENEAARQAALVAARDAERHAERHDAAASLQLTFPDVCSWVPLVEAAHRAHPRMSYDALVNACGAILSEYGWNETGLPVSIDELDV